MAKAVLLYSGILIVVLAAADPYPNGQLAAGGVSVFAERAKNRYAVDTEFRTNGDKDYDYDDANDANDVGDGRASRPCCRCPADEGETLMPNGGGATDTAQMSANGNDAGDQKVTVVVVPIDAADMFDSQERSAAPKMGELDKCAHWVPWANHPFFPRHLTTGRHIQHLSFGVFLEIAHVLRLQCRRQRSAGRTSADQHESDVVETKAWWVDMGIV